MFNFVFMRICLESKTPEKSLLSSPHKYKNPELEQIINKNKNYSSLYLSAKGLIDDDMEIIAYYLLQNNHVSDVVFLSHCGLEEKYVDIFYLTIKWFL